MEVCVSLSESSWPLSFFFFLFEGLRGQASIFHPARSILRFHTKRLSTIEQREISPDDAMSLLHHNWGNQRPRFHLKNPSRYGSATSKPLLLKILCPSLPPFPRSRPDSHFFSFFYSPLSSRGNFGPLCSRFRPAALSLFPHHDHFHSADRGCGSPPWVVLLPPSSFSSPRTFRCTAGCRKHFTEYPSSFVESPHGGGGVGFFFVFFFFFWRPLFYVVAMVEASSFLSFFSFPILLLFDATSREL